MAQPAPSRKRSQVWNHFTEVANKKAKCSYCPTIMGISGSNTGNLTRHLRKVHPTVPLQVERQSSPLRRPVTEIDDTDKFQQPHPTISSSSQPSIQQFTVSTKPIPPRRAEKIDQQLVRMVAKGHYSFSMVEDVEFVKLVEMLCPQYKLPTRKTLSESLIPKMHRALLEKVKTEVEAAPAVCLTTDGWTSINNDSFVAVTAHYLCETSDTVQLKSSLLGCVEYSERHTATNLTAFLKDMMAEWKVENKTTAIASDNAANVTAAIRQGEWRQIPCFAHTLNLCVQSALAHLSPTMAKVKAIVEYFRRSPPAQNKLKELQKQLGIADLKLKQECPTRWNSSYDMLQRLITTKEPIIAAIALLRRSDLSLSATEWTVIENAVSILKLYYDITVEISAEKNVTLSKVIPLCRIIANHINNTTNNDDLSPELKEMLATLNSEIQKRFSKYEKHILYSEATILDPRFKDQGFGNKTNYEKAFGNLKLKVGRSPNTISSLPTITTTTTPTESTSTHAAETTKTSFWDDYDDQVSKLTPINSTAAGIVELDKYIQEPLLRRIQDGKPTDPLKWWYERRHFYPILYRYIMKRLHLVATSVPCERIFSKAGYTMNERRTRLTTKKLSQLLFISHNSL